MRDGVQHAEVQLSPQDLGPIRVQIAMEGAQTRVEMSADVQSTRDALQQAMPAAVRAAGPGRPEPDGGRGVRPVDVADRRGAGPASARAAARRHGAAAADGRPGRPRGDDGTVNFAAAGAAARPRNDAAPARHVRLRVPGLNSGNGPRLEAGAGPSPGARPGARPGAKAPVPGPVQARCQARCQAR